MKNFKFKIEGNEYEVAIEETDTNLAKVQVNGKTFVVEVEGAPSAALKSAPAPVAAPVPTAQASAPQAAAAKPAAGENKVKSPLPGTISKIAVSVGQAVKKGDLLLVMEAMKMENNILAAKDGVIKTVDVQTGQTVLPGDLLVIMLDKIAE